MVFWNWHSMKTSVVSIRKWLEGIKTESERFVFRGFHQFPAFCGKIELDKGILHDSPDLFDYNIDFPEFPKNSHFLSPTYSGIHLRKRLKILTGEVFETLLDIF